MDSLDQMNLLREEGQPFVLATVVRVEKPTSARPGAKAIITQDGKLTGWIGGSCAEPTVLREAAAVLQDGNPRLLRLCPPERMGAGPQEGVTEVKLTCMSGGTLEIYLEPYRPQPQLLVIGHHPVVETLTVLGKALDYTVTVMGLEIEKERFPSADRIIEGLDFSQPKLDGQTYVIVASHGNYDEPALEAVLPSPAPYVALVASKKRAGAVRKYLSDAGLSDQQIARLKYPAGLDIGAAGPQEIALSILAEIVQVRHQGAPAKPEKSLPVETEPQTALDLICGMTVRIDTARFTASYNGEKFYFCSAQCQHRFEKEPEKYLSSKPSVQGEVAKIAHAPDHPSEGVQH